MREKAGNGLDEDSGKRRPDDAMFASKLKKMDFSEEKVFYFRWKQPFI